MCRQKATRVAQKAHFYTACFENVLYTVPRSKYSSVRTNKASADGTGLNERNENELETQLKTLNLYGITTMLQSRLDHTMIMPRIVLQMA